jgi:primosomal protein N' (replication factor Y) (superfamily II helicase)
MLAEIALPKVPKLYTYRIPEELTKTVTVGYVVHIYLRSRLLKGYVVNLTKNCDSENLKDIQATPLPQKGFLAEDLPFYEWIAKYYHSSLGEVIETAVPNLTIVKAERYLVINSEIKLPLKSKKQQFVYDYLKAESKFHTIEDLISILSVDRSIINRMLKNETINLQEFKKSTPLFIKPKLRILNQEQLVASNTIIESLKSEKHQVFMIHGITGSGKTEVYLHLISEALARGGGAIIILPEISLTPQFIAKLNEYLPDQIAILHSGLTNIARTKEWNSLLNGDKKVALGARSAIFAPVHNLKIIVVDEEHDGSFKQSDNLRYQGRDISIVRAKLNNCPIILGSATPSLETFRSATEGRFVTLKLNNRFLTDVNNKLEFVNLKDLSKEEMASKSISKYLHTSIENCLAQKEQIFLLYNRRGYSHFAICGECGNIIKCSDCDIAFTFHENIQKLVCHYCGIQSSVNLKCSKCSASKIKLLGAGTEKIFEEIAELFPNARIDRFDRDSANSLTNSIEILNRIKNGITDIVIGTQMIAKGHDFPAVTLVGVIDCDIGFNLPDFRATERAFQLLMQVSGRAGRSDKPGRVILQTRNPDHPAIINTINHDYYGFAVPELEKRKELGYPPYSRLLRLVISSEDDILVAEIAQKIAGKIIETIIAQEMKIAVLGPCPAPLSKIKRRYRWHIILKSRSSVALHTILYHLQEYKNKLPKKIRLVCDLDPNDML